MITPPCFPARPVNGGPLPKAQTKHGDWLYEPKFNGWRAWVHVPTGAMFNRYNKPLSITSDFSKALVQLREELARVIAGKTFCPHVVTPENLEWSDVEALERRHNRGRGSLIVLDFPRLGASPQHGGAAFPLIKRGEIMRSIFCPAIDHCAANDTVYSVPQFTDGAATYAQAAEDNKMLGCEFYEGVVAKRADSLYPMQLRSPDIDFPFWMKHRWAF